MWDATSTNKGYTHYASKTASRLDRIYVTKHLRTLKTGVETIATAFTDHFAVVLRLAIDAPLAPRGRGCWKMNISLLQDETQWTRWQQHKRFYPNTVKGWGRYAKRMMRQIFIQEGISRRRDRQTLENFYYKAIYTALQEDNLRDTTFLTLKQLKAKIVRLYHEPHHI